MMFPQALAQESLGGVPGGHAWERRHLAVSGFEADSGLGCSTSKVSCCSQSSSASGSSPLSLSRLVGRRATQETTSAQAPWRSYESKLNGSEERQLQFHPLRHSPGLSSLRISQNGFSSQDMTSRLWQTENQEMHYSGVVTASLNDGKPDRSRVSSPSATTFSGGSSFKLNRMESTLPLSATATSLQANIRVLYSLAAHAGLVGVGCLICQLSGADVADMIRPQPMDVVKGVLLAFPPILLAWFLQLEFLVQKWEVARGVRDADDEELLDFYLGMSPGQYIPVAVASAVAQEVFFRAALQGGLALVFHLGGPASLGGGVLHSAFGGPFDAGMAAVSDHFTAFAPFSQLHAAVVMAVMTGTFDYASANRSVPDVIVTDGRDLSSLKSTFGEWHQRQQLKSIYAPMFTSLLALYFGLEWICVGNLMAPMITHSLYLAWSMQSGLARLDRMKLQEQGAKPEQ